MVFRWPLFVASAFVVLSLIGFAQTTASPMPLPVVTTRDEHAFTDWARRTAIPLKTTLPESDSSDLAPLADIVGDARIVELGEATHGTSEFFHMKDRMVRYLAMNKGFTIFSIEANMPEAYKLNDYVLNGVGDPKALLKGMYFWTWNTQEVLDMILWMRQYNQSGKGRLQFTGFDMQTPTLSLEEVHQFVAKYDPSYAAELDHAYNDIGKNSSVAFGVATAQLPVALAAGHRITLSGYIKTENIQHGFAGFWLRVDGLQKSIAFDGMDKTGPKGTTPWTRYEVTVTAPADARAVYFGAVHPGSGTAWFDSLQIDIDGVPYRNPTALDLDFESPTPSGFLLGGDGYRDEIDSTVAHTGKHSLRIERTEASSNSPHANTEQSRQLQLCRGVLDDLEAGRSAFLESGASQKEIDWAIQNARLLVQFEESKVEGESVRDRAMAENIEWIANQNPGAEVIVWAHNGHIGYSDNNGGTPSMGGYLKRYFGPQIVNFGFIFDQGSFRAVDLQQKKMNIFTVAPAPVGTWDEALAATGIPLFALDLRRAAFAPETAAWMKMQHETRSVGAAYREDMASNYFFGTQLQSDFDAICFVEKTTAAHGLPF